MESAQREIMSVLLKRLLAAGLITKSTFQRCEDLVYSAMDLPDFFACPVCSEKGGDMCAGTPNTQ